MGTDSSRVFINYRREDTGGEARLLYDRLAGHFGAENVFLDVHNLQPGMLWLEELRTAAGRGVFLALIGTRWLRLLKERERRASSDDILMYELDQALKPGSGVAVIPVLVGDAIPPMKDHLPRSLWPLAERQLARIRPDTLDDDIARLVEHIATTTATPAPEPPPPVRVTVLDDVFEHVGPEMEAHLESVAEYMREGTVVPVLGPGPDLVTALADHFQLKGLDLAEIAQRVSTLRGEPDLYRQLKIILSAANEPGPVHRFFASVPRLVEEPGRPRRPQLIVTTNFDTALETAFEQAGEPYDLAVYMTKGEHASKFLHLPYEGEGRPILEPNRYTELPINEMREIERTLIVKIHGAVDGRVGNLSWQGNYVVTEDHYIRYLSHNTVANLVPVQILDTLLGSHCLFLGYTMHDWHLRVFLERIWRGMPLEAISWAIQDEPEVLDRKFWGRLNVDLFDASLEGYVHLLERKLATRQPTGA